MSIFDNDEAIFCVVVNREDQHSIWPADAKIPAGWTAVGARGTKAECLAYIERAWTDMRPLSLRTKLDAMARSGGT